VIEKHVQSALSTRPAPPEDLDWSSWLRRTCRTQLADAPLSSPEHAEAAWETLTYVARREGFTVE
jgi:hypothetical protein